MKAATATSVRQDGMRPRILLLTARAFVIPKPRYVARVQARVKVGVHPRGKLDVLGALAPERCFRTATPAKVLIKNQIG